MSEPSKIKIARYKDDRHTFKNGCSCQPILVDAYDQVSFKRCILQQGHSTEPELHPLGERSQLFLFFGGKGFVTTPRRAWNICEPALFVPEFDREVFQIHASADAKEPLEFLHIVAEMNDYDRTCLREARITLPRFRGISQGWTYWENFKDEDTTSLMMIEHRNLGRLSMGAVLGKGPTKIGQHIHNELVQWYFPLKGSSFTYEADGEEIEMTGGDLSYTPMGIHHGSSARSGEVYDYVWFELCENGYPGEIK